jgi:hypothetical protein
MLGNVEFVGDLADGAEGVRRLVQSGMLPAKRS